MKKYLTFSIIYSYSKECKIFNLRSVIFLKVAFIACEYNPFHNGHYYHIKKTKENGADAVVCIMSGNFVQRGDIAVTHKHIRAKAALLSGADLIIELPVKFAVSDASHFAEGYIRTAEATGLDGFFSFGSKADLVTLRRIKDSIYSAEAEEFAYNLQQQGFSYPVAKSTYVKDILGSDDEKVLLDANNILALEYMKNAEKYIDSYEFFSVLRNGSDHSSMTPEGSFASAGFIRQKVYEYFEGGHGVNGLFECEKFIPSDAFNVLLDAYSAGQFPTDSDKFNTAAFSRLLLSDENDFRGINNVSQGLENRIIEKIRVSNSLSEAFDSIKTKRFTHARIRQILLHAVLGITKNDLQNGVSYLRILGFNNTGRNLLHNMRNAAKLPVIMNLSDVNKDDPKAARDTEIDYSAGKLFNLCTPCPVDGNPEYNIPPVVV